MPLYLLFRGLTTIEKRWKGDLYDPDMWERKRWRVFSLLSFVEWPHRRYCLDFNRLIKWYWSPIFLIFLLVSLRRSPWFDPSSDVRRKGEGKEQEEGWSKQPLKLERYYALCLLIILIAVRALLRNILELLRPQWSSTAAVSNNICMKIVFGCSDSLTAEKTDIPLSNSCVVISKYFRQISTFYSHKAYPKKFFSHSLLLQ